MSTTVCPSCGTGLEASARFCPSCGQPLPAGPGSGSPARPGAAPARKVPVLPLAIFGGGLVALVGALVYMKSGTPPAGGPIPATAPASPSTSAPVPPALPGTVQPSAPLPEAPAAPATTSVFSFPETVPPASSAASGSAIPSGPPPAAGAGGTRAPSTKVWKDPLAGGEVAPPPPAPTRRVVAGPAAAPPPPSNHMASGPPPDARPVAPAPPQPQIAQTFDCRENVIFNITPEDILITVDGHSIGTADRWDGATEGRKYTFREPGVHLVKLSHEKYQTVWLKFEVSERSIYRTADVEFQMKRR